MQKEIRNSTESLSSDENRMIVGYAIVFNKYSRDLYSRDLGGFTEIIEPNSLDGVLEQSDVLCLLNHNVDRGVLARYKYGVGSLHLEIDEYGLKYSFTAPNTALGDEVLESIKRGDITTSSFAFIVDKDEVVRYEGKPVRIIKKFKEICDVSPVYHEAYPDTTVGKRSIEQFLQQEKEQREIDFKEYFQSYDNILNELNK